jgi:hypothetical protein
VEVVRWLRVEHLKVYVDNVHVLGAKSDVSGRYLGAVCGFRVTSSELSSSSLLSTAGSAMLTSPCPSISLERFFPIL